MRFARQFVVLALVVVFAPGLRAAGIAVAPVRGEQAMVVAAHPEVAQIGADVLRAGGNAVDAAVAVSLALGVAEPYGSGLGGKLALLYHDAASGRTFALDALDEAGRRFAPSPTGDAGPEDERVGWSSVCVPGLAAGLHEAHRRWGARPWAEAIAPVTRLARDGFLVLPKTRQLYAEQAGKLRRPFAREAAAIFLVNGELPAAGSRQANPDLAGTLELLAQHGRDGFYRGPVAEAIVAAARAGGGHLTAEDLANYEPRFVEPIGVEVAGHRLRGVPPPAYGGAVIFAALKVLESDALKSPLLTAPQLDRIGRVYLSTLAQARAQLGDLPQAREVAHRLIDGTVSPGAAAPVSAEAEGTTHFVVVDRAGNIVCATQSLSHHFGAGVVAPGTGVVMNNSVSNFTFRAGGANAAAPGRRPRSTIAPILVFAGARPVLALGLPGSSRIPSGLLQVLADHLLVGRPIGEAIADTRVHWAGNEAPGRIEAENTLPAPVEAGLRRAGWKVDAHWTPGGGSHFGGVNAVVLEPDGARTGYADPRRTNAAVGF